MTDRELLELAAKAADVKYEGVTPDGWLITSKELELYWNPLENDGDALRMAVEIATKIDVAFNLFLIDDVYDGPTNPKAFEASAGTTASGNFRPAILASARTTDDPYAATRRAIVRAAAEIGKGIKHEVHSGLPEDNYYKTQAEAEEVGRADAEIGKQKE